MRTFQNPPFILFADDDLSTLDRLAIYVQQFGWEAEYVQSARAIIQAVNSHDAAGRSFDALVCDVNFLDSHPDAGPHITGVAAARAIRENHPNLPIVFVSSYIRDRVATEISKIGAEYFDKSEHVEKIFERVAYLIRWSRATASTPGFTERRSNGINFSGNNRRRTDQPIVVPEILTTMNAEIRARSLKDHN